MPDDAIETSRQDEVRIKVNQPYEVAYWTRKLRITPEQLKAAVCKVGPVVKDVRQHLSQ